MTDYLPKNATLEEACEWMEAKTSNKWTLPRLLEEAHLVPYVWIDFVPGNSGIFGDRLEGYLTKMIFHGDVIRLAAERSEALLTMFPTHDGKGFVRPGNGWRVSLKDIRFQKDDLERAAEIINKTAQSAATPAPVEAALVELDKAGPVPVATRAMADSFAGLHWDGTQWKKKLGDKPVWLDACVVLNRGRGEGQRLWNPVLIGSYLVRKGHVQAKSVRAKFQTQPALKPWLDEWKTYEADNHPTD